MPDVKRQKPGEADLNFVISEPKRQKKPSPSGAEEMSCWTNHPEHENFLAAFQAQLSLPNRWIAPLLAMLPNPSAGNIEFVLTGSGIAATADGTFTVFDRGWARLTAHDGVKIALALSPGPITANGVTYTNAPTNYAATSAR